MYSFIKEGLKLFNPNNEGEVDIASTLSQFLLERKYSAFKPHPLKEHLNALNNRVHNI